MARLTMPLASHAVLRTTDLDEARTGVGASLAPHQLTLLEGAGFEARHNVAELNRLSLHYIDYGAEVEVTVDGLGFQLIQIPLAGVSTITGGARSLKATPRAAVVTGVGESLRMRYSAGNPRLMVRVDSALLRDRLAVASRGGLVITLQSCACLDITRGRGRSWRRLIDVMLADLEGENGLASAPLAASTLELGIVDGLIASLADQSVPETPEHTPQKRVIKRAASLIDDHCAEPLGTPDVAEAVGLSVRALQAGFKTYLNTTPMAYIRHARLLRVREALTDGSAASVTDAAMRWGITHLGRLSGDYRAAFGESPNETLRRTR